MSEVGLAFAQRLITSGHIVDIALIFIIIEFVVLATRASLTPTLERLLALVLALGPGACLMLAVRCALTNAGPIWVAFWLAASLPLHLVDIARRKL